MKTQELIEKQQQLIAELESYGCSFRHSIGVESEMAYAKNHSGNIVVSDDVDFRDIYEDGIPSFFTVENSWRDSGFRTASYPVKVVTFC